MKNIALLGGSFNPAHQGHLNISIYSKEKIKFIDEIWWIITPHNPLKKTEDFLDLTERVNQAKKICQNYDFIKIKLLEEETNNYTISLLKKILAKDKKFFWLMGADNLANFHLWKNWQEIANLINIIVFPREDFLTNLKNMIFYKNFADFLIKDVNLLKNKKPPYWFITDMKKNFISATKIRNKHK